MLTPQGLAFGAFVLDPPARQLRCGGELVPLPAKAFDLLVFMASNAGRPLLKSELLAAVWPDSFVEESNLSQNVFLLRKALGSAGASIIQTLPGRGYQFAAPVSLVPPPAVPASTPSPVLAPALPPASPALQAIATQIPSDDKTWRRAPFWRTRGGLFVVGSCVVLLAAVAWIGWLRWQDHVGGPPVQVVIADLEGSTGDPVLDRTLTGVMRIELAQSPFVTPVPAMTAQRTLAEMRRTPEEPLTPVLAREVCERTGSQAVLHGSVARAGTHFMLMDEAINCVDGVSLAAVSRKVERAEDFPDAVMSVAASLRQALGESRRTIARFNAPLIAVSTSSLEALKEYTQATTLGERGQLPQAIELLKQAVALDPRFAAGWLSLSNMSANALDPVGARAYAQRAFDERAYGTEPTRLYIVARYNAAVTADLFESRRNYEAWANMYPRAPQAWSGLTNVNLELGDASGALAAARRTEALLPDNAVALAAVARAQARAGDYRAARATCERAIGRGLDSETFRYLLLRLGHLEHDAALVAAQNTWLAAHPQSPVLLANELAFALQEGRLDDADVLRGSLVDAFRARGEPSAAAGVLESCAETYAAFGLREKARALLAAAPPTDDLNGMLALANSGDPMRAAGVLEAALKAHPQGTLLTLRYAPLVRGRLAMLAGKPREALTLMEPSRQLDGQSADGFYLRGQAALEARQLSQAEAEFRSLLAHPEIEPNAYQLPLACLQLARTLALAGRSTEAREAYAALFAWWGHSNGNLPLLAEAHREAAALPAGP